MKIAVLSRNGNLYSTRRLVEASKERGHEVEVVDYLKCYFVIEKGHPEIHYHGSRLSDIKAIIPRIGASHTFYGTAVVRQFEIMNIFSANESQAITRSRDKLRSMQLLSRERIGIPITAFASSPSDISHLIEEVGGAPLVVKLLQGTQGIGVVLAETKKAAESVLEAFYGLDANMLIQEFVSEAKGADIRAFVVGDKVVGAMKRQGAKDEFRSNIHRGGTANAIKLSKEEHETAVKAARVLGLNIAGVDMLQSKRGPLIMEVNSSPGLEGIEVATNIDIAGKIVEFIEKNVGNREMIRDRINV
ncbi:MAG: 30S ribosomal protein S6--L-glutamate ligase [Candidatus Dadabacteria bacterium]|nr:30S ribosomal protein S6--L-glutamate ligase [Candidatus Dadabacteria bacterium]